MSESAPFASLYDPHSRKVTHLVWASFSPSYKGQVHRGSLVRVAGAHIILYCKNHSMSRCFVTLRGMLNGFYGCRNIAQTSAQIALTDWLTVLINFLDYDMEPTITAQDLHAAFWFQNRNRNRI